MSKKTKIQSRLFEIEVTPEEWLNATEIADMLNRSVRAVGLAITDLGLKNRNNLSKKVYEINKNGKSQGRWYYSPEAVGKITRYMNRNKKK
jgi:hypothetical protein